MADLSNLKISETYGRVLQKDPDTGELQNLLGAIPTSIKFNGTTLQYVDGNQQNNFILTSDAQGNASWAVNSGADTNIYWSANTDGSISPSGLTTSIGIGTSTPNKPLTVVGDISGTTDLYLGSSTHTASTITAQELLHIKGQGSGNDYMVLGEDNIDIFINGAECVSIQPNQIILNASTQNIDTKIMSETDGIAAIHVDANTDIVRLNRYILVNGLDTSDTNQALYVSGSSLFYSGGTSISRNAITAVGAISGTTDLYVGENLGVSGRTFLGGEVGFSATTFLANPTADSSVNPMILTRDIANSQVKAQYLSSISGFSSYWSADTTVSDDVKYIRASGNTTSIKVGGDLEVSGDTQTTNLILGVDGYIMPAVSNETIKFRAQTYDGEMASIGEDLFNVNMNGSPNFLITPTRVTFNASSKDQDFQINSDSGEKMVETKASKDLLAIGQSGSTTIGGTTARWPTDNGQTTGTANKTLQVNGITIMHSGGTGNSWSANTTALTVVGNIGITGNTFLDSGLGVSGDTYIAGPLSADTMSGRTLTLKQNLGVSGHTFLGALDASGSLGVSGDTFLLRGLGVSGDTYIRGPLSADTMSGRTLTLKENLGVSGRTYTTHLSILDLPQADVGQEEEVTIVVENPATSGIEYLTAAQVVGLVGQIHWSADTVAQPADYVRLSGNTTSAIVGGKLEVTGATIINNSLSAYSQTIKENLGVSGHTYLGRDLYIKDNQFIYFGTETDTNTRIRRTSNNLKIEAADDILLLPDDDLKIGVGGTQYAYFYGNEREFHITGNIYASAYLSGTSITGETLELKTHAGITGNTFLGGGLGVSGDTYIAGPLSADTMSGRTLTLKENLGVSGTTHITGPLYSANHDVLAGSTFKIVDLDDGFYGLPGNAGWSNTSWGSFKTNGASGLGGPSQQIGITLPYKAILVGVKGVFRSSETGNHRFALWTAVLADNVATGTWSETITTANINVLTTGRPFNFSVVDGTTEFAAGTQIIPSFFNDTGADNADIFGNYMVIIKRVE